MRPGDMVRTSDTHNQEMVGIILHVRPMENCFRDSYGKDQIHLCTVLMSKPVPGFWGGGKVVEFTDSILEVIHETG